jgi:hypothetical protein
MISDDYDDLDIDDLSRIDLVLPGGGVLCVAALNDSTENVVSLWICYPCQEGNQALLTLNQARQLRNVMIDVVGFE